MFCLKHCGDCAMMLFLMDYQHPVLWLNFSAGTGNTGYWLWWWSPDDHTRALQYSVRGTISCSRKPRVVPKAVTSPGLSHVLLPRSRACTSTSGGGLCGVLSHISVGSVQYGVRAHQLCCLQIPIRCFYEHVLIFLNFSLYGFPILLYVTVLSQVGKVVLAPRNLSN